MQTHTPLKLDTVPVLSWEANLRPHVERTHQWYIAAGVVVLAAAIFGIISGSWSFAIVSVLAGGMYTLVHDHAPPVGHIEIHDTGVLLDGQFTRWDELAGYWLLTTLTYTELHLTGRQRGEHVIQTGSQDVQQLKMVLGQRIPELTKKRERFIDTFIRTCKL